MEGITGHGTVTHLTGEGVLTADLDATSGTGVSVLIFPNGERSTTIPTLTYMVQL